MRQAWLLVPLVIVLLLPISQAAREVQRVEALLHPTMPTVTVGLYLSDDDGKRLRQAMDENQDLVVTQPEVDAFAAAETWNGDARDCLASFRFLDIDGQRPEALVGFRSAYVDATGDVGDARPLLRIETFLYRQPSASLPADAEVEFAALDYHALGQECLADQPDVHVQVDAIAVGWSDPRPPGVAESTRYVIGTQHGVATDPAAIAPSHVQKHWTSGLLVASTPGARADFEAQPVTLPLQEPSQAAAAVVAPAGADWGAGAWLGLGILGTLGLVLATEVGRYHATKLLLGLGLYSRLSKDAVLENKRRDELYQIIRDNSDGPCLADLRRLTGIPHGPLVHHLGMLEQKGLILAVRDGFRTRYFLRGPQPQVSPYLNDFRRRVLETVRAHPDATQSDLVAILGLNREMLAYHLRCLVRQGELEVKAHGRWRRYSLAPRAQGPPNA